MSCKLEITLILYPYMILSHFFFFSTDQPSSGLQSKMKDFFNAKNTTAENVEQDKSVAKFVCATRSSIRAAENKKFVTIIKQMIKQFSQLNSYI